MKIAIIADDLTGANDTGVQFARAGLKTSVLMKVDNTALTDLDAVVVDTDSRSLNTDEAYNRVKCASKFVKSLGVQTIFKKIDSTLRGNVGIEYDAIYDAFEPDLIIIAPAYPKHRRLVREGCMYLDNILLHESEMAADPKTPVHASYIPDILKQGTRRNIAIINEQDLAKGSEFIKQRLANFAANQTPYIVFDSASDSDLEHIVDCIEETDFNVLWSGSAGLAQILSKQQKKQLPNPVKLLKSKQPVFMVVGSVNKNTRLQLDQVLSDPSVQGIKLNSHLVVSNETALNAERQRVLKEIEHAVSKQKDIVLYSTGGSEEIQRATETGKVSGLNKAMVSDKISQAIGDIAATVVHKYQFERMLLTGGDTAKKVCTALGITEFKLMDEIEVGIPIGQLVYTKPLYAVTKAGGFGSLDVLIHSLQVLKGENVTCAQS